MCDECGCSDHHHDSETINIREQILHRNNHIAEHNREHLKSVLCLNWISAPGSGKTSLLETIIQSYQKELPIAVIEGDQETDNDAKRIQKTGAQGIQINTNGACHLDAEMIHKVLPQISMSDIEVLMIENVGNMVCPTSYDLGEDFKIAVISAPEGTDKPVKYPDLLLTASVLLINKIDLLSYLDFNLDECINTSLQVNPNIKIFPVSAKTGEGLNAFFHWLKSQTAIKKAV